MAKRRKQPPPHYILQGNTPIEEPNLDRWQAWHDQHQKDLVVNHTQIKDLVVETAYAGFDKVKSNNPPKLFRTTVTGGGKANGMFRGYHTKDQAAAGHTAMLSLVKKYFADSKE